VKVGRGKDDGGTRPSGPATTRVTEPHLTVAEGTEMADPAAMDEVLEILATWAIRAHGAQQGRCGAADDSVTCDVDIVCEGSN
jgi:hypothetical protein